MSIEQNGRLLLAVRAQSRRPGPGQQIFCLRERELDPAEPLAPLERVPVARPACHGQEQRLAGKYGPKTKDVRPDLPIEEHR